MRPVFALLLLAIWLGAALLLAAVVAPAAFAALPSRSLAGAVVGRVLPVIFLAGIIVGLAIAAMDLTSRATPFGRGRMIASLVLAAACAVAQFGIGPRIARLRAEIGPSLEALAADDARRVTFGRLHGLSVAWMGVGMLAAMVAIVLCILALRPRS